jgi:predicted ribosomally synthesized peptide with SipW-like signal peptide
MPSQPFGRRRPLAIIALAVLSIASIGSGVASLAIWTDSATSSGTFTAGTIDLTTSPSTLFTVTGAVPGDSGSASLTVANAGTASLRYAMTSSSTNADGLGLRNQLQLTITAGACPGGSTLYATGAIASAAFGDPTQGSHSGDRTLAASASEQLCFAWSLPASTGNAYQGATTTTTFTFAAEQTSSNP